MCQAVLQILYPYYLIASSQQHFEICGYYPCTADEETEAQREVNYLPKIIYIASGRAKIQIKAAVWL